MLAQEDQSGGGQDLPELAGSLETVQKRHADVQDNNVGPKALGGDYEGFAVGSFAHDFKLARKGGAYSAQDEGMIVAKKNTWSIQSKPSPSRLSQDSPRESDRGIVFDFDLTENISNEIVFFPDFNESASQVVVDGTCPFPVGVLKTSWTSLLAQPSPAR